VQQLKLEMSEKDELVERIKIQLNIFKIRQAKQEGKVELIKNEELQTLKRKYGNILKKYHEVTQELAAYRRKEERMNFILSSPSHSSSLRTLENSLSLSP
jgi:archaellum component FlaC